MKVVILCGGIGSRLAEETKLIPKPMVKLGGRPIISHIIEIYKFYGFNEFILATGYKNEVIKNYFKKKKNIKCIFTGKSSMTGGRLLRLKKFFDIDENFMLTYGDGLTNQNLKKLLKFHLKHKKIATMTVVKPVARFDGCLQKNVNLWDIAAGTLLVKEAGGIVDNFDLKEFSKISIKASNERISGDLNKKINIF